MCGIFGAAAAYSSSRANGEREDYEHDVVVALQAMRYRGPDSQHAVSMGGFTLGLARLAIVDTHSPEAEQPFCSARGSVTVFNGELYNYRALWADAPSEVALLADMIDSRVDVRQYLDGDYAVVHHNPSTHKLTLYRDRFGVCPLYYQLRPFVAVSSEARRLENPREVPAHGKLVIDIEKKRVTHRSVLPLYGATGQVLYSIPVMRQMLFEAVRTRALHTESSFSVALSGGLDSSLVLLALHAQGFTPTECLVTGFSPESEDIFYARLLAESLGAPLRELLIPSPEEMPEESRRLISHMDSTQPVSAMRYRGALRSWFVAKNSPTRVVLSGDGADELLGGYPCHAPERNGNLPYMIARKRLSTLRSMQHFNLDRTNKMGMAHSREFRVPLLASSFSQLLLSSSWEPGKDALRRLAKHLGAPYQLIHRREKYSPDELAVESVPA